VDTTHFTPNPSARAVNTITVVAITRLVYRKGIDLMVGVIPEICRRHDNVQFVIGGEGPKRLALEEMREKHQLQDRVELLGHVNHDRVRSVLCRGHIYLNCSLTEAFCIAILEAAACGLLVVSTKVGGVPEVMPEKMIKFADPVAQDLTEALSAAIVTHVKDVDPFAFHEMVQSSYCWHEVAERTMVVYENISAMEEESLWHRLQRKYQCGPLSGKLFSLIILIDLFLLWLMGKLWPQDEIEIAWDYPLPRRRGEGLSSTTPRHGDASWSKTPTPRHDGTPRGDEAMQAMPVAANTPPPSGKLRDALRPIALGES